MWAMAKAVKKRTPTYWHLTGVLRYLTFAPFGYEIDAALREMTRRIGTGELWLRVEHCVDGKSQSYWLDPYVFLTKFTLELDQGGWVRLIRQGIYPRVLDCAVTEQNVRAVWPPRAAQAAPVADNVAATSTVIAPDAATKIAEEDAALPPGEARVNAALRVLEKEKGAAFYNLRAPKRLELVSEQLGAVDDSATVSPALLRKVEAKRPLKRRRLEKRRERRNKEKSRSDL
jgi:hypothetical protein